MKKELIILEEPPIILTKDADFLERIKNRPVVKSGEIILLPEDAILVKNLTKGRG